MTIPRHRGFFFWVHCINCQRFHLRGRYTLCRDCEDALEEAARS